MLQEERRRVAPQQASALDDFLANLDSCIAADRDFTLVLDDPAGNSYVERPEESDAAELREERYERSAAQAESIGLSLGAGGAHNSEVMPMDAICMPVIPYLHIRMVHMLQR